MTFLETLSKRVDDREQLYADASVSIIDSLEFVRMAVIQYFEMIDSEVDTFTVTSIDIENEMLRIIGDMVFVDGGKAIIVRAAIPLSIIESEQIHPISSYLLSLDSSRKTYNVDTENATLTEVHNELTDTSELTDEQKATLKLYKKTHKDNGTH